MRLTKTDFIQFLNCHKSLWLLKREPENYPFGEFSLFLQKIIREGYEVERFVRQYFEGKHRSVEFQPTFETEDGLYARADVLEKTSNGEIFLYEVKSPTKVKTDAKLNHLKDACFQKICAERSGQQIDRVFIVHLNGTYKRDGAINPEKLLTFVDVTEKVAGLVEETSTEMDEALALLGSEEIDRNGCPCLYKSRGHHCDTFSVFNPDIPVLSIYSLPRLTSKQCVKLVSNGIFELRNIPGDYALSESQRLVVQSAKSGKPQVNTAAIKAFFSKLAFPLYFLDYETFSSAIPLIEGASPHRHFPVQYSLHILEEDGNLAHRDYLERKARMPLDLIERMRADVGPVGSIVSWHASFEAARNREMAKDFPDRIDFLNDLNQRMVDLEDIFKKDYVDARFDGSTSIKKVLPVLCPNLGYSDLDVQDGVSAMETWERMLNAEQKEAEQISRSLLSYCERDTFAMVEIYRFLATI